MAQWQHGINHELPGIHLKWKFNEHEDLSGYRHGQSG
jgi:hypothetical protein